MTISTPKSDFVPDSAPVEQTLRWLANLPAPAGLEERVLAKLEAAPRPARFQVWPLLAWPCLAWPRLAGPRFSRSRSFPLENSWLRSAAAAAIVAAVVGGGWAIQAHIQPAPSTQAVAAPSAHTVPNRGFSTASAMRTPQTLVGPLVRPSPTPAAPNPVAVVPTVATPRVKRIQPAAKPLRKKRSIGKNAHSPKPSTK